MFYESSFYILWNNLNRSIIWCGNVHGMTSVDKQLNCVFWFQNPLKDLVRPLYNYSRTDPVRCPDSPSLYMSCVLCLSLSLSTRSLLYQASLIIVGNFIFPFYVCLNYLGRILLYLCRTVIVFYLFPAWMFWGECWCIYITEVFILLVDND